jgi:gluconate 2-dehydrogenase gamma chain
MDRRKFIKGATSATAMAGLGAFSVACKKDQTPGGKNKGDTASAPAIAPPTGGWKALDEKEAITLSVALERIVPAGTPPGAPGAADTGLIYFLDAQLAESHFSGFKKLIKNGARALDDVAARGGGGPFSSLPPQKADALLEDFQKQRVQNLKFAQGRFFAILHTFAMEGYLGSPRHGGNKDKKSWAWLGIQPGCPQMHNPTHEQCGD